MTSPTKFYDVIQIILQVCSCDQSLVTVAFLWEKLSQSQFYKDLTRKTALFEGWSWFKFNNLGLAVGTNLKFYTSVVKGLKLKVKKFWVLIPTFVEVTDGKLIKGEGGFLPPIPLSCIGLRSPGIHLHWFISVFVLISFKRFIVKEDIFYWSCKCNNVM